MAYGDTPYDGALKQAWDDFCDQLKAAAAVVFREGAPSTPADRAEGFRYLSRLIGLGLDMSLESNDPMFPQLTRYFGPTRKQGGDNPDAVYLGARIDGRETYRIVGRLGGACYVVFTTLTKKEDMDGGHAMYGTRQEMLLGSNMDFGWDGSFELVLSPREHAGNWIRTTAETTWVTIRQFFADWENEEPMTVRIERAGADGEMPAPLTPERTAAALREAGRFVGGSADYWARWLERYQPEPNKYVQPIPSGLDGGPGGTAAHCYWAVKPDEALLIEVTPPHAQFWNFEFNNYWMTSVDYRYRLSSTNCKQAVLEEDGSLRIAIAHTDPGIPNWLDTAGHSEGRVGLRWMQADGAPLPATRLVKLAELLSSLPASARRTTPEERREQLGRRGAGVAKRFRV